MRLEWEVSPGLKSFHPKCSNLDVLDDYRAGVDLGDVYWSKWRKNPYSNVCGSMVDHTALLEIASSLGHPDMRRVKYIAEMLMNGAVLGVEQEGRWPSRGLNKQSAYQYGDRVADSLQTGLDEGFLCGPFTEAEARSLWPEGFKVAPIQVRLKPNGSARIIMDLSYPHKQELGCGEPCSVNEGLKHYVGFETPVMTTDVKLRRAMYWAGFPFVMAKTDWCVAYKHVSVHRSDHCLQLVEFGGRYFLERCLTFGCSNSPIFFNMVAKLLIELAGLESGFDKKKNCQQLDDNCVVDALGSPSIFKYLESYRRIAERMNVRLASEDDPSKAFAPCSSGELLGIIYDGSKGLWKMPYDKGCRLLCVIGETLRTGHITNGGALSLAGRINHYSALVGGKSNRCLILHLGRNDLDPELDIVIGKETKLCLVWWLLNLRALQKAGSRIPHPDEFLVNSALVLHSDAAGGDSHKALQGWGLVNQASGEWARGSWPMFILKNKYVRGQRWGRRLSLLEGFAAVLMVPLWAKDIQRARGAALMCDNIGFMYAHRSGSSTNEYIWTLIKCLADLSEGLGVTIKVFHTSRRTSVGDQLADDLSKGVVDSAATLLPDSVNVSDKVSKVLLHWISDPYIKMELGRSVLLEIQRSCEVDVDVGFDYKSAARELGI